MKSLLIVCGALAGLLSAESSFAASPMQPPMNNFNEAYYTCDADGAFLISYDSNKATTATITTSNNNKRYALKRAAVATGAQFSGDGVKFWTDGKMVVVEGTQIPLLNCKLKGGS